MAVPALYLRGEPSCCHWFSLILRRTRRQYDVANLFVNAPLFHLTSLLHSEVLIKENKVFDFIMLPGQGHSNGGVYGDRKRNDFFVHNLLGVEPPDWNLAGKAPAL